MSITLEKLIELNEKLYDVLGWRGGGILEVSYDVSKVGDAWLYIDINDSVIGYNLLDTFSELYDNALNEICNILGAYEHPGELDFAESETSDSGYVLVMKLLEGEDQ